MSDSAYLNGFAEANELAQATIATQAVMIRIQEEELALLRKLTSALIIDMKKALKL